MTADRYAHPTMGDLAKGAAEFVAPRTVEDGVNLTNVLGDIGELTPLAPAVPFLESRLGLREWDDDTIAAMALLGLIPFGGKVAREAGKGIRKTAEAIERIPKGNKGGFIRNPMYDWNKLTPEQKAATTQAMEEWTSRAKKHTAAPQTPPVYNEFWDDNLNEAVDNVAGDYKFTPKLNGKKNPDIKTQAMLPENTGEAAFLRHDPYVSNYDKVLTTARINAEEERLARAGLLPQYVMDPYDDMGHFAKAFPTVKGSRGDIGNSAKGVIIDDLERKFPGYRQVMQGKGPGQSRYIYSPMLDKDNVWDKLFNDVYNAGINGQIPWSNVQKDAQRISKDIDKLDRAITTGYEPGYGVLDQKVIDVYKDRIEKLQRQLLEFNKEDIRRAIDNLPD